jgi:cob(I)alamin adenosyltransferase
LKIYTKTGDTGQTSLLSGERVEKSEIRIDAYGSVDELNSFIGLLRCETEDRDISEQLNTVQNKLFNIGSLLATQKETTFKLPKIEESDIVFLEIKIDEMNEKLPALKNFILPGGNKAVSLCHVCRTVCRRAEREAVRIQNPAEKDIICIKYLNRLSDYFFVLSRYVGKITSAPEINWVW